jgi:hypothetical protein
MIEPPRIKALLKDRTLSKVAEQSGVEYKTLWRFVNKDKESITYPWVFIKMLSNYLESNQ